MSRTIHEISTDPSHLTVGANLSRRSSDSTTINQSHEQRLDLATPPRSPVMQPSNSQPLRYARVFDLNHTFDPHAHWYPRALNAQLHPMMTSFLGLGNDRIIERFCHLNPSVNKDQLQKLLKTPCEYFRWSGADCLNVCNRSNKRSMIVIETNSCPSGQKSMPTNGESLDDGQSAYHTIIRSTFKELIEGNNKQSKNQTVIHSGSPSHQLAHHIDEPLIEGGLAVIYDKNDMEASGYAAAMRDIFNEPVYLAELYKDDVDPPVRWDDGVMSVRTKSNEWKPIRAAFRYVTQKPWQRIPLHSKTRILNPVIACLAGGRNKMIADKAYEFFNMEIASSGLSIRVPDTIRDVSKSEIPLWVQSMGGLAVIKIPYSNAGQGVYTITSQAELDAFMAEENHYDKYIVQSLVGNASWVDNSVQSRPNQWYHCGTIPNKRLETFVCDLRVMVSSTHEGFQPLAVYARRALTPLCAKLTSGEDSWKMLGTNLSEKRPDGSWTTDTSRLLLMDCKDFNKLGIAIDELIDAYVQTCLATLAIDRMAQRLMANENHFDRALYASLNNDQALMDEIMQEMK